MKKILVLFLLLGLNPAWADNGADLLRNILLDNAGKAAELLQQGVSPDTRDTQGNPALGMAVSQKRLQIVRSLLAAGAQLDALNNSGMSPLMIAASKGYQEIALELLNAGAQVDLPNPQSGATALFYAVQQNHPDTARLLLEFQANPALADHAGKTPAQLAEGKPEIAALFAMLQAPSGQAAQTEAKTQAAPPLPLSDSPLNQPASLREKLPLDTLAYVRIPSLWGLLSAPKDTALAQALANPAHQQGVAAIEAGLYRKVLHPLGVEVHPLIPLLLHHQRSPLEVAILLPPNMPFTVSHGLASVKLDLTSLDQARQLLDQVLAATPELQLVSSFSPSGEAALNLEPFKLFLRYETDSRTLYVLAGMAATPELLGKTLQALAPVAEHPMSRLESRMDPSAQGSFQWLNIQKILPLFSAGIPPEEARELQAWGLFDLDAAALSWGSRAGKGRLQLRVDAPRTGYRELLPVVSGELGLTSAGEPGVVFSLSLPLLDGLRAVEAILQQEDPEEYQAMQAGKAEFTEMTGGISLEDALAAFSGQIVLFTDQTGEFLALRLGDAAKAKQLLDFAVNKFNLAHHTREFEGKTYHHLVIPNFEQIPAEQAGDPLEALALSALQKIGMHYYWVEDQGHWIFAQVPQALRDYLRHGTRVKLQDWVKNPQQQDNQSSLLLLSTRFEHVPRYLYHTYLQVLGLLADVAETEFDLFSLPSAQEAKLPASGTYGLQVDWAENSAGMEITFENNPLEFLLNPNLSNVAVAGILAAVAIPAYSDYIERAESANSGGDVTAQVSEALNLLSALKTPAEEFMAATGQQQLPPPKELGAKTQGKYTASLYLLDSGDGYAAEFHEIEGRLILRYDAQNHRWECSHEGMNPDDVPSPCK